MKMSKGIRAFLEEAKKTDSYWVEKAKLDFSLAVEKQRRSGGFTYAAIAKKIGTSAAYITKIFRGDTNMTIETMVKLARATGGQLDIQIVDSAAQAGHWDLSKIPPVPQNHKTMQSATVYTFPAAANHDDYKWKVAA
ncbi:helix-turn-helix transcriptional regulator [Polaromonas sp. CG_23.6]|uniref:helix-turn-helix domain-containing protein n=1 Tax=Polaromonas sp. CG_23.6 TaxID=2760709 RepID=UPI002475E2AB|nr:helix-turn-helix transcriptional regulator [Polaromonas sp. CG_23.6]MDH6185506.1 transcriptional regulator with XRE-family HTH domain [Polaromonas sp. CG_23.6]